MTPNQKDRDHVSEEAALWLHRLSADDSPECHAEFDQWIRQGAAHLEEFLFAKAVWAELDQLDAGFVLRTEDVCSSSVVDQPESDSAVSTRMNDRLSIEHSMRAAIRENQFYVDYQPIVDLRTNKLEGLEALIRWRHPVRGLVPPVEFIDVAEKSGLITELGEFVMQQVCLQIRRWQDKGAEPVPVAINVSGRQFERQDIANLLARAASTAGIDVRMVRVELTESAIVGGSERHLGVLRGLRALGVPVSIDDFGTGYSSLAYLKNLPIDCLKIDRAFVCDMITSANGDATVTAIIRMASSLGLRTIAEGVETLEQLKRLRGLGATMGQGFFFSPPLSTEAAEHLLIEAARQQKLTDVGEDLLSTRFSWRA